MSACVTAWVAPQTSDAPGASVVGIAGVHVPSTAPTPAAVTATPVSVWVTLVVTLTEYVTRTPPESYGPVHVTGFPTRIAGSCRMGPGSSPLWGPDSFEVPCARFV